MAATSHLFRETRVALTGRATGRATSVSRNTGYFDWSRDWAPYAAGRRISDFQIFRFFRFYSTFTNY